MPCCGRVQPYSDAVSHYAPLSYKTAPTGPRAPDHPPMGRLRRLGLRREEEADVYAVWDRLSDAERIESVDMIAALDDDELRAQIIADREERKVAGTSAAGPLPQEFVTGEDADAAAVDPEDVPDGPVPMVLEWVGDSRARAAAALLAEQRRHDPVRKTLVAGAEAVLG